MKNLQLMAVVLVIVLSATGLYAGDSGFAAIISKNGAKYQNHKIETYLSLKLKAESDLWEPARDNSRWFVENFYTDRYNEQYMVSQMRRYLFPENIWEEYLFATAIRVDLEVKKLIAEILTEAGVEEIQSVDLPVNMLQHYATRLPNAAEIAEAVYRDLEAAGVNRVPRGVLLKAWERFVIRYPKSSLTFAAFVAIVGGIASKNPYIGGTIFAVMGGTSLVMHERKEQYYAALVGSITDKQNAFNTVLKNTTFNMFDGVLLYLNNHPARVFPANSATRKP